MMIMMMMMMMMMMVVVVVMMMENLEQRLYGRFCPDVEQVATLSHNQLHVHQTPENFIIIMLIIITIVLVPFLSLIHLFVKQSEAKQSNQPEQRCKHGGGEQSKNQEQSDLDISA